MMTQHRIVLSGITLNYWVQNENALATIFFIHGNSVSSRSWKKQFASPLLGRYRLIAFDLPAHGDSDGSINPLNAYSLPGLGEILAEAVKKLSGNNPYILTGVSLGTNIVVEMLNSDLNPNGIALAGSCILGHDCAVENFVKPDTHIFVVFTDQASQQEVGLYAKQVMRSVDPDDQQEFITDYYRVKLPFRSQLNKSIQEGNYSDQIELLRGTKPPVLLLFGKQEKIINPDYLDSVSLNLWKNTIFKIEGGGHLIHLDQPEEFNLLLAEYAIHMILNH